MAQVCERLLVYGLGLIGGSIAAGARAAGLARTIHAVDRDAQALQLGHELGLLDSAHWEGQPAPGDLIVVAVPTLSVSAVLESLWDAPREQLAGGATVTDVASVKGTIVTQLQQAWGQVPANFVPGHPIAGSERSGVQAANAQLFADHRVILTPTPQTRPDALHQVVALWQGLQAQVEQMPAASHDQMLAMTSHLPHLLAFTLVDTLGAQPEHESIFRLAAGGFRDFTRIAASDAVMWSDIFSANRSAVLTILDEFESRLATVRAQLAGDDRDGMRQLFAHAKALRDHHLSGQEPEQ